jgi:hypothetical protein
MYELLYREERIQRIWLLVAGRMRNPSVIMSGLFSIPVTMLLWRLRSRDSADSKALKKRSKASYFHVRTMERITAVAKGKVQGVGTGALLHVVHM